MTDEEILFDFLTVQETRKAETEALTQDPEEEVEPTPVSAVPQSAMDGNRKTSMSVKADMKEFISWYEQEVGPWQHPT